MNIVIPMAGLGSRFRLAGFDRAKPLIPVEGRPMYTWAVESLPLEKATRLIFILLRSQPEFTELRADILHRYGKFPIEILDVPSLTAGQSETVMRAETTIDNGTPLLIHNADTAFEIDPAWSDTAERDKLDGALLVFRSTEARWLDQGGAGKGGYLCVGFDRHLLVCTRQRLCPAGEKAGGWAGSGKGRILRGPTL
jgi:NDP-sugar pyrophosphorylase family protein